MSSSAKVTKYTPTFPEEGIPEEDDDSDSSDDERKVRPPRWSTGRRPRFSVVSEANPSPRVSAFEAPNPSLFKTSGNRHVKNYEVDKTVMHRIAGITMFILIIILLVIIIYLATKTPKKQQCQLLYGENSTDEFQNIPEVGERKNTTY